MKALIILTSLTLRMLDVISETYISDWTCPSIVKWMRRYLDTLTTISSFHLIFLMVNDKIWVHHPMLSRALHINKIVISLILKYFKSQHDSADDLVITLSNDPEKTANHRNPGPASAEWRYSGTWMRLKEDYYSKYVGVHLIALMWRFCSKPIPYVPLS